MGHNYKISGVNGLCHGRRSLRLIFGTIPRLRGVTDKVGIDATKPLNDQNGKFSRAIIPGYDRIEISKYFPNILMK